MAHRGALILLLAGALALAACRPSPPPAEAPGPVPQEVPVRQTRTVTLFFLSASTGDLSPVLAEMEVSPDPAANARRVLDLLLAGPQDPAFAPPLPPGSSVRGVFAHGDILVADLALPPGTSPVEGTRNEMDIAGAVANTVCLNIPEFKGVRLLLNGTDHSPLFTHLDLSHPLRPRL